MIDATEKWQPQGIAPTGKSIGDMVGAFESFSSLSGLDPVEILLIL